MAPRLVLAASALLLTAFLACGESEEAEPNPEPTTKTSISPTATSPAPPTPTPSSPTNTPAPVPSGWMGYLDGEFGFSLSYPPDLVFEDLTSPTASDRRVLDFGSASDEERGFVIDIIENTQELTIDEWSEGICQVGTKMEGTVAGSRALFCTREVLEGHPESTVLTEYRQKLFLLSARVTEAEFELVVESLRP
jgi:hypothetical protein